jgi:hypothetical protein
MNLSMQIVATSEIFINNSDDNKSLKTSQQESGGKVFSQRTETFTDCYINNRQPGMNRLPNIFIKNSFLSEAEITFDNIVVHNITNELEPDYTAAFKSRSYYEPTYIYQKFWIDKSEFLYNVSIYILDEINELRVDETNSWEVAIMNCSNDGVPFENGTIKSPLSKNRPGDRFQQWFTFDFLNSPIGPIFLDKDNTNYTIENGVKRYWFAIRVKMPPDDTFIGGGAKYLFFKPDGEDPDDIDVGATFFKAQFYGGAHSKVSTENYVAYNNTINGIVIEGDSNSFNATDSNRYIAQSNTNNLSIETKVDFNPWNSSHLYWLKFVVPTWTEEQLFGFTWDEFWDLLHPYLLYGFDINIGTNVSQINNLDTEIFIYNASGSVWFNATPYINIKHEEETLVTVSIRDKQGKDDLLSFLGYPGDQNSCNLTLMFNYTSTAGPITVSFNEVTIDLLTLKEVAPLQKFDPGIKDLFYPINFTVNETTGEILGNPDLDVLKFNDNNYLRAKSHTNNLTLEFEFNLVPYLNSSAWIMDQTDYQYIFPNPSILEMLLALTSNVSIGSAENLSVAQLEIYLGSVSEYLYIPPEAEGLEWLPIWGEELLAHSEEFQVPARINSTDSWFILQFINASAQNNSLRFRLRYEWNESQSPLPPGGFNVTIDQFSFDITVQNAVSSDFTTMIGIGLNSSAFVPPDINLKVQGTDVANESTWAGLIADGTPSSDGYFEFNVTSDWEAVSFDVMITYTTYKYLIDMDFEKKIKTQYMTGTQYFSVEVTDETGNELEDLELLFELLDDDGKVVDEDTAVTNDEGVAKGSLKFDEVGDDYTIKVSFEEDSIYATDDMESDEFRIVDDTIIFIDNLLLFLPYIIAAIAAITIFVTIRHRKMSKLREYWAREALTLDDLLKISYILIIHKDAGVTIYNKQISMELDSDLIGGFLTAISQFRSELKKDKLPGPEEKGIEMDYYDFKIVITDGEYVRVALILDGIPSERLKEHQWDFTRRFEKKFKGTLDDFTGDVRPYTETDYLVDKIFNISLMYPLQLGKHWEDTKLNKLEKSLIQIAEQIQKERKFIFVSSLLSYGLAGRKESRDQIVSTIISLKRRGILVPLEVE